MRLLLLLRSGRRLTDAFRRSKRLIEAGALQLPDELVFVQALLTRQPKAPQAWEHRCVRRCALRRPCRDALPW